MTLLTIPPARMPLTIGGLPMSPDWYRWADAVTSRAGGVNGLSTGDVDAGSFAAMQPIVSANDSAPEVLQPSGPGESLADVSQPGGCCSFEIYPMQA